MMCVGGGVPRKARRAVELRPQAVPSRPLHSCPSPPPNFNCNSCPNLPLPTRDPKSRAAAGTPLFPELRFLSALCLAPGVAVCDTVVALPLHRHPQLSAEQLGQWGQGTRYVTRLGGSTSEHHSWGLGTSSGGGAKLSRALCSRERSEQGCGEEGQAGQGPGGRVPSCKALLESSYRPTPLCPLQSAPTQMPLPSLSSLECCVPPGMACSWIGLNTSTRRKQERQVRPGLQRIREPGGERSLFSSMPIFSFLLNPFLLASVHSSIHHSSIHPSIHHPSIPHLSIHHPSIHHPTSSQ